MKKKFYTALAVFFLANTTTGYSQIYLFIEGVKTDVSSKARPNETLIQSFSWGATKTQTTSGGRTSIGKVSISSINLVKNRDMISSQLQAATFTGKDFPKAEIRFYKPASETKENAEPYLVFKIEQVSVESYQLSGSEGEKLVESISLTFTKIITEEPIMDNNKPVRKIREGWDVLKNEPIK